jgi:hypothetical protein
LPVVVAQIKVAVSSFLSVQSYGHRPLGVGTGVGAGSLVGAALGCLEGLGDGKGIGSALGFLVGFADSKERGFAFGSALGSLVRFIFGKEVGSALVFANETFVDGRSRNYNDRGTGQNFLESPRIVISATMRQDYSNASFL